MIADAQAGLLRAESNYKRKQLQMKEQQVVKRENDPWMDSETRLSERATRCVLKRSRNLLTCTVLAHSRFRLIGPQHVRALVYAVMALARLASWRLGRTTFSRSLATASGRTLSGLNTVTEADITHFSQILPESCIISTLPPSSLQSDALSSYNTDWIGRYVGKSTTVLRPKTTEQVSAIMKHCWDRRIGVVPQGGNTGLVGGGVPLQSELILSLGNMSKIRSFDPVTGMP